MALFSLQKKGELHEHYTVPSRENLIGTTKTSYKDKKGPRL